MTLAQRIEAIPLSAAEEAAMAQDFDGGATLGQGRRWGFGVLGLGLAALGAVVGLVFLARPPVAPPVQLPPQRPEAEPRPASIPLKFVEIVDRATATKRLGRREAEFLQGLANVCRDPAKRDQCVLTDEQVGRLRDVLREVRKGNLTIVG
jgi:hypothetical protein